MKDVVFIILLMGLMGCNKNMENPDGIWRAELLLQGDTLPFNFEIETFEGSHTIWLLNGDERLRVDDVKISKDSLHADLHIFDTQLEAKFQNGLLIGHFKKNYADDYILPFSAKKGETFRFSSNPKSDIDISGVWEVQFESSLEDSVKSIGEFVQKGSLVTGTFLTTTGDYRYLQGEINANTLKLSCFDGEHAFLFEAELNDKNELQGIFRSGLTWNETWAAKRNDSIKLTSSYELTYLKEGFDEISFSFKSFDGDTLVFPNKAYDNKIVLIQILGTWCPNCMDETKYLSEWYDKNKSKGAEIIGIAYERKNDFDYAKSRIEKVKQKLGADYKFVFGGPSDKTYASESLPMLSAVISFPTLIIIDKNKKVRKIHTGFSGPGTGVHFENFKKDFELYMDELMNEVN